MDKICINCALQSLEVFDPGVDFNNCGVKYNKIELTPVKYNKIELVPYADKSRDYYCPNCGLRHHFVVFPEEEIK